MGGETALLCWAQRVMFHNTCKHSRIIAFMLDEQRDWSMISRCCNFLPIVTALCPDEPTSLAA